MSKFKILILVSLLIIHYSLFIASVSASDYVLPYPSFMPGSKFYRLHQVWEKVQSYWHFGNLCQFKYHLQLSDKYLVEAKTLFEYGQHFLATQALKKSSHHFAKTPLFLERAAQEGKDISQKQAILKNAGRKHGEVLNELLINLPEEIIWQEEKKESQRLAIKELLEGAKTIREKN